MTVPVKNNIDVNSARPVDTAALRVIFRLVSYAPKLLLHPFADLQKRFGRDGGLEGYGLVEKIHGYRKRAREPAE